MNTYAFSVALSASLLAFSTQAQVTISGAPTDTPPPQQPSGGGLIFGFNPSAPTAQDALVTATPIASGVGGGVSFNGGFGTQVGFVSLINTNFFAFFTNQFGTNVVLLPFAATNLGPFAGRLPLGPLAPPSPLGPTNSAPGAAPAVPPQTPFVDSPPPTISPVVPQPGGPPPTVAPFPPTGRPLTPPTVPGTPSPTPIPPRGTPTPSPTPIPPSGTPTPR
jgi:hypothetical protein